MFQVIKRDWFVCLFVWMYVCMCVRAYSRVYVCRYAYVYVSKCLCTHVCMYVCLCAHTHTHITLFGIEGPKILLPPRIYMFRIIVTTNSDCILIYLRENSLRLHYKHQSGNAAVIASLSWELYETNKFNVLAKYRIFYVETGGTYSYHCRFNGYAGNRIRGCGL